MPTCFSPLRAADGVLGCRLHISTLTGQGGAGLLQQAALSGDSLGTEWQADSGNTITSKVCDSFVRFSSFVWRSAPSKPKEGPEKQQKAYRTNWLEKK